MATAMPLPEQLVYLIIRFATSIPDLPLSISTPRTTTTLSLKQLIRSNLPHTHASARLRLIYAGKVLADSVPLSSSLRIPPPPPPRDGAYNEHGSGSKSKGKQPVRDVAAESENAETPRHGGQKYYIHCSLGDAMSPAELVAESAATQNSETALQKQYQTSQQPRRSNTAPTSGSNAPGRRGSSTTTPAPQGFDRLLASGFTAPEVATLRSQFQTNLSYTHTPDTMPSPNEIRAMEDRWLDSTATDPSPALAGGETETGWGAGLTVEEGGLDDMLYGYLTGFFWPLGALIWGFREEGVWPRRRQLAVVMGVVLNAAFGFLRWSS
ncbi:DUF2407 C-terminal domain-domain-containing protein [Clohesyomyces aquaticus]|uniref:DUF2407 C-terminal domain-domain-containing protein n=1 Tax=Clohesyomyces aquaticus TaxID=1231657 RepID=A0A1Y1ZMZ8_9PLEO|nr:DUF2407 C-terminal domain-domain-containing protein [Clohesyomyces aquaticus]